MVRKPVSDPSDILYAAHTATCTFLLDAEGICRRIVPVHPSAMTGKRPSESVRAAARCVGAQYVASLDANVTGMLAEMPRVGAPMLFARSDSRGRISLVRTGSVTRFETHRHDPFAESGEKESVGLLTSAPAIKPSTPAPRLVREAARGNGDEVFEDVDCSDLEPSIPPARISELRTRGTTDSDSLDTTAEYATTPPVVRRAWPAQGQTMLPPPVPPKVAGRRG